MRRFNHLAIGVVLARADNDARRVATDAIQNFGRHGLVVDDEIGVLQNAQRLHRQKIGIAGTGAYERHAALQSTGCEGTGEQVRIGNRVQRSFGLVPVPGENQRADRAVDHAFPEASA